MKRIIPVLFLSLFPFAAASVLYRVASGRAQAEVRLAVSLNDTRRMLSRAGLKAARDEKMILERCARAGVQFAAIEETDDGLNSADAERVRSSGLDIAVPVHFIQPSPRIGMGTVPVKAWIFMAPLARPNDILPTAPLAEALQQSEAPCALVETNSSSLSAWIRRSPRIEERTLRAHTIPPRDLRLLSPEAVHARWMRAVEERSCRFLYIRWHPGWSVEENLAMLDALIAGLRSRGLEVERSGRAPVWVERPHLALRKAAALLASILGPVLALLWLKSFSESKREDAALGKTRVASALVGWGFAVFAALITGLLIQALLPDSVFVCGLCQFSGVKLALLLPLIFSIFILYSRAEIKGFLSIRPAVSDWLIFFSCAAGLFLMLSRSGNDGVSPHASELWVRSVLENIFGARPRFKEFMIGHPLMILGIYLSLKQDFSSSWLPRALILSGMVGIVSVVNTFEHLHTPVQISLLRTFHGCWIGAVSGLMLILIYERFLSRSQA